MLCSVYANALSHNETCASLLPPLVRVRLNTVILDNLRDLCVLQSHCSFVRCFPLLDTRANTIKQPEQGGINMLLNRKSCYINQFHIANLVTYD